MAFTKKEKNFILKNYKELSVSKIAEILNTSEKKVSEFLISQHLEISIKSNKNNKSERKKESVFGDFEYKTFKTIILENKFFWISISILIFLLYYRSLGAILLSDEISMFQELAKGNINWLQLFGSAGTHFWTHLLFGYAPWANRLVSLNFHILNLILFFAVFRNFISEKILKIAIILISTHSLIVEPVTWIAANPYIYHAFLYLIMMYSSLLFERTKKFYYLIPYYYFVISFTIGGGHTNYAPILIIIFNLFILKRSLKKEAVISLWMLLLIPVFPLLNRTAVESRVASLTTGPYLEKFAQTLPFTTAKSLELVVFPYNLALFHEETLNPNYYMFARLLTIFFFGFTFYLLFKKEKIYFGLIGIACAFCIYIFSPIQIAWFVAERYLYFPVFITCLFIALLINYLNNKVSNLGNIIFVSYFTLFLFVTFNRFDAWSSLTKLWESNVQASPDSYRVRNNLAEAYTKDKNFAKAEEQYLAALKINPNFVEAYYNLSNSYFVQSKFSLSENYLLKTIEMNPSILESYIKLAIIKSNSRDFSSAYAYVDKARKIDPNSELINKFVEELKKYEAQQKN